MRKQGKRQVREFLAEYASLAAEDPEIAKQVRCAFGCFTAAKSALARSREYKRLADKYQTEGLAA